MNAAASALAVTRCPSCGAVHAPDPAATEAPRFPFVGGTLDGHTTSGRLVFLEQPGTLPGGHYVLETREEITVTTVPVRYRWRQT